VAAAATINTSLTGRALDDDDRTHETAMIIEFVDDKRLARRATPIASRSACSEPRSVAARPCSRRPLVDRQQCSLDTRSVFINIHLPCSPSQLHVLRSSILSHRHPCTDIYLPLLGMRSTVICVSVRLSVCLSVCISRKSQSKFHQIFCTCYL